MTTPSEQPASSNTTEQIGSHCYSCMKHLSDSEIKRCARCKSVSYCSATCQAEVWPSHKANCSPQAQPTAPAPEAAAAQQPAVPTPEEFKAWSAVHKTTISFAAVDALELSTPQGRAELSNRTLLLFLNHHPTAPSPGLRFSFAEGEVESFSDLLTTLPPHLDLLNTRDRLRADSLAVHGPTSLFSLVVVVSGAEENAQLFVMPLSWKAEELEEFQPVSEVPWRELLQYAIRSGRSILD